MTGCCAAPTRRACVSACDSAFASGSWRWRALLDDVGHRPKEALADRTTRPAWLAQRARRVRACRRESNAHDAPVRSLDVRASIVTAFRRDLIGPGPQDADLARERLNENPSRWYLTGFLAPAEDPLAQDGRRRARMIRPSRRRSRPTSEEPAEEGAGGAAGDDDAARRAERQAALPAVLDRAHRPAAEPMSARSRRASPGATTAPSRRCPRTLFLPRRARRARRGRQAAREASGRSSIGCACRRSKSSARACRTGAASSRRAGKRRRATPRRWAGARDACAPLQLTRRRTARRARARAHGVPGQPARARVHRLYADVSYAFQARLELVCAQGFVPRHDLSGYRADDRTCAIADLHYRDVCEYAVGRNVAGGWDDGRGRRRPRDAGLDRSAAAGRGRAGRAERGRGLKSRVTFGMEALAERAAAGGAALAATPCRSAGALRRVDRSASAGRLGTLAARRRETAERLIAEMETARRAHRRRHRAPCRANDIARTAFRFMNLAVAMAARRRNAGATRRSGGADDAGMATVPARLHPAQPRRPCRPHARRPRDRRPAVLPDRRRQDRGLSRPRRLRHRASPADAARACSAPASPSSCATRCAC